MSDLSTKYPDVGSKGSGLFLKLNDGDTVKVRLMSDPIYFDSEYKGNLSSRFAWVVYNQDENKAQIWATNGATYNSIKDLVLDEEYGDPTQYDIKITRTGTEQQTRYSVRPGTLRNKPTAEMTEACEALNPIELIDKPDSTSHVMWLNEHREEKSQKSPKAVAANEGDDEPINLDDGEEVDLSEIPF